MAFSRASAIRGALRAVRPHKASVGRAQPWRQIGRRGYASHGHDAKKASSDLPWAVGAVAITAPTCWYLLQNGPKADHGHKGHGGEHEKEHGEKHEEHAEEEYKEEPEASGDKNSEKGDDSDSGDESEGADTPDTSDYEDKIGTVSKGDQKEMKQNKPEGVAEDETKNMPTPSKAAGAKATQSGKQGLGNSNNPDKSRKGEDVPETSKTKGTAGPKGPQA